MGCSASSSQGNIVVEDKRDFDSGPILKDSSKGIASSASDKANKANGESGLPKRTPGKDSTENNVQITSKDDDQKVVEAVISYMAANPVGVDHDTDDDVSDAKEFEAANDTPEPMSEDQVVVERALEELKESVFGAPIQTATTDTYSNGSFTGSL